jgi:preprotein translocase subunit SecE
LIELAIQGSTRCRPALTDFRRGFDFPKFGPGRRLIPGAGREGLGATGLFGILQHPFDSLDHAMAFSPFKFLQEVRSETAKVTWPSRRETTITTIMVFVMVALASIFFFAADQLIRVLITFILGV